MPRKKSIELLSRSWLLRSSLVIKTASESVLQCVQGTENVYIEAERVCFCDVGWSRRSDAVPDDSARGARASRQAPRDRQAGYAALFRRSTPRRCGDCHARDAPSRHLLKRDTNTQLNLHTHKASRGGRQAHSGQKSSGCGCVREPHMHTHGQVKNDREGQTSAQAALLAAADKRRRAALAG